MYIYSVKTLVVVTQVLTVLILLVPLSLQAALTSENYVITRPVLTSDFISQLATSSSYQTNGTGGSLYRITEGAITENSGGGGGGGESESQLDTPAEPEEVSLSPLRSEIIGPRGVVAGEQVTLVLVSRDTTGALLREGGRMVTFTVRGANRLELTGIDLGGGSYRAEYTAGSVGDDRVTARINGETVGSDSDGESNGILNIRVISVPLTDDKDRELDSFDTDQDQSLSLEQTTQNEDDGEDSLDSTNDKTDTRASSGVLRSCHPIIVWEEGSASISRSVSGGPRTQLASISSRMPWFIDTSLNTPTNAVYTVLFGGGYTESIRFTPSDFVGCDADNTQHYFEDVDADGNLEHYIQGLFFDPDGSTVPRARGAYGVILDTRRSGPYDLFWNPLVGTSEVIAAGDRIYIVSRTTSSEQQFMPPEESYYRVSLIEEGTVVMPQVDTPELMEYHYQGETILPASLQKVAGPIMRVAAPVVIRSKEVVEDHSSVVTTIGASSGAVVTLMSMLRLPFSLSTFSNLFSRGWMSIVGLIFFSRKRRAWGTVYDSVTKAPVDPAYVELYTTDGTKVAEAITDIDGRYGFLVSGGTYVMNVMKAHYQFPSRKVVFSGRDVIYSNLYLGGPFTVSGVVAHDVPVDPLAFDWNQWEKMRTKQTRFIRRFDHLFARLAAILFYLGFLTVLWSVMTTPNTATYALTVLYVVLFIVRLLVGKPLLYGTIRQGSYPLPYAVVRIFRGDMEVMHKVSDVEGRYVAIVTPGTYTVTVEERTGEHTYRTVIKRVVTTKDGIINADLSYFE